MLTATLSAAPRALDCNTSYMHTCVPAHHAHICRPSGNGCFNTGSILPGFAPFIIMLYFLVFYSLTCKLHLFQNLTVHHTHDTQVLAVMYFMFNFIKKIDKPFPLLKVHTVFDFLVIILTSYCMLCRCAVLIHLVIAVSVVKNKHMFVFSIPTCTVSISYFRIPV